MKRFIKLCLVLSGICPNCKTNWNEWWGKCPSCGYVGTPLNDE